jgi:hypothetical protein
MAFAEFSTIVSGLITFGVAVTEFVINVLFDGLAVALGCAGRASRIARLRLASGRRLALLILWLRAGVVSVFHLLSLKPTV